MEKETSHQQPPSLKKHITGFGLYLFIVGDTLGAGIYALVGTMLQKSGGAVWIPMICAMVLVLLTATSYGQLVSKYPSSAGVAAFVDKAFNTPWFTFLIGFMLICSTISCAASLTVAFSGRYLQEIIELPAQFVIPAVIIIIMLFNLRGVKHTMTANIIMTLIEATGLGIIILAIGMANNSQGVTQQLTMWRTDDHPFIVLLSATALAIFAFLGFEGSASLAEEVQDVRKNYPRALLLALLTTGIIYVALGASVAATLPLAKAGSSNGPLIEILKLSQSTIPLGLFGFIALVAVINGALLSTVMASRMLYGLSKQGKLPKVISESVNTKGAPWLAIILTAVITYLLCVTADLEMIAQTVVILVLIVFITVNVCAYKTHYDPIAEQVFFAPRWAAPVAIAGASLLLTQQEAAAWFRALLMVIVGLALYFLATKQSKTEVVKA